MGAFAQMTDEGWSEFYDERNTMTGLGAMGAMGAVDNPPLIYTPNLNDVGHGASYNPGPISADAHALNFLGFITDNGMNDVQETSGSVPTDMAQGLGAFGAVFRQGVTQFQQTNGITVDGFIGPQTRSILATQVATHNALVVPVTPPNILPPVPPAPNLPVPVPVNPIPPGVLPTPPGPGPAPAPQSQGMSPMMIGGLVVGGLALLGLGYWALSD